MAIGDGIRYTNSIFVSTFSSSLVSVTAAAADTESAIEFRTWATPTSKLRSCRPGPACERQDGYEVDANADFWDSRYPILIWWREITTEDRAHGITPATMYFSPMVGRDARRRMRQQTLETEKRDRCSKRCERECARRYSASRKKTKKTTPENLTDETSLDQERIVNNYGRFRFVRRIIVFYNEMIHSKKSN